MEVREATADDWSQIWPIFGAIVQAGETYAFDRRPVRGPGPGDLDGAAARSDGRSPSRTVSCSAPRRWARTGAAAGRTSAPPASWSPRRPAVAAWGGPLATYVVDWHREQGYRGIQFNAVVETNTAAVALWRSLGFAIVGTVPEAFEHPVHGYVGLHVMHLPLR